MIIEVRKIIDKSIAVSTDDAKKVKKEIAEAINIDNNIEVSFENINMLISHFLNVSIGELYTENKNKWQVLDSIKYIGINNDDLKLLKDRVIPSFKNQPTDKEKYEAIQGDILK
jgi:hypothetical protein